MKTRESFMYILGGLITLAIIVVVGVLVFVAIPEQNQRVLDMCLGGLLVAFTTVVNYFFGSSRGSADKTEIMKNERAANPPAV